MIPYSRQSISPQDIESVVEVLQSDFLTQGAVVPAFESALAQYTGAQYAVAVNSGTSALHIACLSLGLSPGDMLWTSPISFTASANCALYCGAAVDFVDVNKDCPLMDMNILEDKLVQADKAGRLPKVVVPVHYAGLACDMAAVHSLADKYGFSIIEDACHALGGSFQDHRIGSCHYSDITVFSFHPIKSITTGEGGAALSKDADLSGKMQLLRTHGITRDSQNMVSENQGPWHYEQIALGYNYRMTDVAAAFGKSQLSRIDQLIHARHELAKRYDRLLEGFPLATLLHPPECQSAHHLYPVCLTPEARGSRREVFLHLRENGIGVNVHYIPIYAHPYYRKMGFTEEQCPNAQAYYEQTLSLPLYPDMTHAQQDKVIEMLTQVLFKGKKATGHE